MCTIFSQLLKIYGRLLTQYSGYVILDCNYWAWTRLIYMLCIWVLGMKRVFSGLLWLIIIIVLRRKTTGTTTSWVQCRMISCCSFGFCPLLFLPGYVCTCHLYIIFNGSRLVKMTWVLLTLIEWLQLTRRLPFRFNFSMGNFIGQSSEYAGWERDRVWKTVQIYRLNVLPHYDLM